MVVGAKGGQVHEMIQAIQTAIGLDSLVPICICRADAGPTKKKLSMSIDLDRTCTGTKFRAKGKIHRFKGFHKLDLEINVLIVFTNTSLIGSYASI